MRAGVVAPGKDVAWGAGEALSPPDAAAEVLRKSRRDALISQAYEIPLGSQAYFAMLRGQ